MRDQPAKLMDKAEFHRHLGDENIVPSLSEAIKRAKDILREQAETAESPLMSADLAR
jgi:protein associated with RNAse G/E